MAFDCQYDRAAARYSTFNVKTRSRWAPAQLVLEDCGQPPTPLVRRFEPRGWVVLLDPPDERLFLQGVTVY
jgi:hypothetical protein